MEKISAKKCIVIHSGGMDSSICLKLASLEFGPDAVLSLSFSYGQRHSSELEAAAKISKDWGIDHQVIRVDVLSQITENALVSKDLQIDKASLNTLVLGRNGLMARLGAIFGYHLGTRIIYMGVMELEGENSGYRDCSRRYMDLMQEVLKLDLDDSAFEIRTPLIRMTKLETLHLAHRLDILKYLLENTITCYEGLPRSGCKVCPACLLKNRALEQYVN